MSLVKYMSFRGHPYKIAYTEKFPQDPSWFTYDDEVSVRDRQWDVKPGDVVLDVGAAFGSYAVTALACGAEHVFAWSPDEGDNSLEMFGETIALNGWTSKCTIINDGVYSADGWINPLTQSLLTSDVFSRRQGLHPRVYPGYLVRHYEAISSRDRLLA